MSLKSLTVMPLSQAERQQIQRSMPTFRKLAGADEVWDHADVERNASQVADSSLWMGTVNFFSPGTITGKLHGALNKAGVSGSGRPRPSTDHGRKAGQQEISRDELNQLQRSAQLISNKASKKGPVHLKFNNGIHVSLLQAVGEGKSVVPGLLRSHPTVEFPEWLHDRAGRRLNLQL